MSNLSLTDAEVRSILGAWSVKITPSSPVAVLAVRDADGDGNEFGVYDDRLYVVTRSEVRVFDGNTDPSRYVNGRAQMETGQIVTYVAGKHKLAYPAPRGYAAFRQFSKAWFVRRGVGRECANIAANLHRGAVSGGTSSEACQTVPYDRWNEFRGLIYGALGLTVAEVLASPLGKGLPFPYLILSRGQVAAALADEPDPAIPDAPVAPSGYAYFLPDGRKIPETLMQVGVGYGPTRATMALMLNVAEAAALRFEPAPDNTDSDDEPDLFFVDNRGRRWPIDVLDADLPRTLGRLTDLATAAGLEWTVNTARREVRFDKKKVV